MALWNGRKAQPAPFNARRPITSAAQPVRLSDRSELEKIRNRSAVSQAWQTETWRVYDVLGEVNFAFNLIANAFSRIRFHAAVAVNPDEPPVEVADGSMIEIGVGRDVGARGGVDPRLGARAREFMAKLNNGHGMGTLQRAYALNRQVTGECYLCCIDSQWSVKSTSELLVDPGGGMRLQPSVATATVLPQMLPADASVYRMWNMHPRYSLDPDCQLHSVLYLCEQLIKLNRMINNTVASRMNAGILLVASEIAEGMRTPGTEPNINSDPNTPAEIDPFDSDVQATMTQPVQDDAAGAAVVPMIIKAPYQYIKDGIHHLMLARDVDQHMLTYAENVLGRVLNGINIPKDAITGFQNVRYANAQQITEDTYKQGVEPLALAFADELTDIYLKPMLRLDMVENGWDPEQVDKMVVWYDPSEVVTRPDRGADADAGWDRGALSDDAWRRAHGFSADDAPSEEETVQRTLFRSAQLPPNLIDYAARKVFPEWFAGAPPLVTQSQAGMAEAATQPLHGGRPQPTPDGSVPPRNPANGFRPHVVPGQAEANPAGSDDQEEPPGGRLPPRTGAR